MVERVPIIEHIANDQMLQILVFLTNSFWSNSAFISLQRWITVSDTAAGPIRFHEKIYDRIRRSLLPNLSTVFQNEKLVSSVRIASMPCSRVFENRFYEKLISENPLFSEITKNHMHTFTAKAKLFRDYSNTCVQFPIQILNLIINLTLLL